MTAESTLIELDAAAMKLIGPSPSDANPGDAVKRLIEAEKTNKYLIKRLMDVNQMGIPGSGNE